MLGASDRTGVPRRVGEIQMRVVDRAMGWAGWRTGGRQFMSAGSSAATRPYRWGARSLAELAGVGGWWSPSGANLRGDMTRRP